jgi:metacaspase-1
MTANHKGISLHLGLNHVDPDHYRGWDGELAGCQNDARDLQAIAQGAGFDTTLLLDEQATAEPVKAAIAEVAGALAAGDVFLLTYSGHGSQVPDKNGDETEDGYDETWVLFDRQLVDDELYELWSKFATGVRIVVLSDSCHSGTAIRDTLDAITPAALGERLSIPKANGMRTMPKAQQREVYKANQALYDGIQAAVPAGDTAEVAANVLLLSGCQDNQTSADGKRNGLFTQTLLEVWDSGNYKGGYKRFYDAILDKMPPWQSPNWLTVGPSSTSFQRRRPFTI